MRTWPLLFRINRYHHIFFKSKPVFELSMNNKLPAHISGQTTGLFPLGGLKPSQEA